MRPRPQILLNLLTSSGDKAKIIYKHAHRSPNDFKIVWQSDGEVLEVFFEAGFKPIFLEILALQRSSDPARKYLKVLLKGTWGII